MVTINEVAKKAGVSIATVSNVLNGRADKMSKETFSRVQTAIEGLGYQPSRAAQQLKTGCSQLLGLLVPSIGNPSYAVLAREIEIFARERHGYRLIVGNTYRDPDQERAFLDDLGSHGVRGVIVISSGPGRGQFDEAIRRGMVALSFDMRAPADVDVAMDYVSVDNAAAARLAVEHLAAHGHRVLAFVRPAGETVSRSEKQMGFLAGTAEAGLRGLVIQGDMETGYADAQLAELGQSLAQQVAAHPEHPTGILTINDMMALGLMTGLREQGLSVPDHVSVIGMDALPLTAYVFPPLTSVGQPISEMARLTVDRIIGRIGNPSLGPQEFRFPPTLVPRASVASPPEGVRLLQRALGATV
jgi:DNA-binding LacI/PurR family transcriptional regulator